MAEMEGRGDQAGSDPAKSEAERDEAEERARRRDTERRQHAEEGEEAVTGPRGGGEEDDREGRMHASSRLSVVQRDSSWSIQRSTPPLPAGIAGASSARPPVQPALSLRGR